MDRNEAIVFLQTVASKQKRTVAAKVEAARDAIGVTFERFPSGTMKDRRGNEWVIHAVRYTGPGGSAEVRDDGNARHAAAILHVASLPLDGGPRCATCKDGTEHPASAPNGWCPTCFRRWPRPGRLGSNDFQATEGQALRQARARLSERRN